MVEMVGAMTEEGKVWVAKLTVSKPDTVEREMARRALKNHFESIAPEQVVTNFLALAEGASRRQKRLLADLVAPCIGPEDAWHSLLRHGNLKWARRAARRVLTQQDDAMVSTLLLGALKNALETWETDPKAQIAYRLLDDLITETGQARPTVSLRPIERFLYGQIQRRGLSLLRRRLPAWHSAVTTTHTRLTTLLAPPDTPLAAQRAASTETLPVPAGPAGPGSDSLPLPATDVSAGASDQQNKWSRWTKRFRR
jgi:hypothetical protein